MRRIAVGTLLAVSLALLADITGTTALQTQTAPAIPIAIVGVRLIDGTGTAPVDDSVVIVAGDRIRAAGPRARVPVSSGATVVDAKGKVLLPGLVDVHCHINQP